MQIVGGDSLYSASDLVVFLGCRHRTTLDLKKLNGWDEQPATVDAASKLVQEYGNRHELAYLAELKVSRLNVVEIDKASDLQSQISATQAAMRAGAEVIFQAALLQKPFLGYADFLLRVPGESNLGDYHYEVADTKLAKSNRSKFMVQLCLYADLVAAEQGFLPEHLHVVLGTLDERGRQKRGLAPGAPNVAKLRTQDYIHYVRLAKANFLEFVSANPATSPVPVGACAQCAWKDHCTAHWERVDHLSRVANIRSNQVAKLEAAGITTMEALATCTHPVEGMGTFSKLQRQAQLQLHPTDAQGKPRIAYLPPISIVGAAPKPSGFALLPEPNPGDMYFDMEGFPHEVGGLEYLFGVGFLDGGDPTKFKFQPFWAHNRDQEKVAFEAFMDFVEARLVTYPKAHIYHYAPYEKTAIQKLSGVHNTRPEQRDRMLREGRLVDLYRVVVSGLQLALPSYSIKKVEAYYRGVREGEVSNAGDSIVQYEAYRVSDDAATKSKLLGDIERYNFDDVESTRLLHRWLESIRPTDAIRFVAVQPDAAEEAQRNANRTEREAREARARQALSQWVEAQPAEKQASTLAVADLLGHLLGFYWRCELPKLWLKYQREQADEADLIDDQDCLALLEFTGRMEPVNRSIRYEYCVPDQETKLFSKACVACLTDDLPVSNFEYDQDDGLVTFTRAANRPAPPQTITLCASDHINQAPKLDGIFWFVHQLAEGGSGTAALLDLLSRSYPRLLQSPPGADIVSAVTPEAVTAAIRRMDSSYLVIQGPPGTGKTTMAAQVIAALLADGKSVGITSNSHAVINHLLVAAQRVALASGTQVQATVVQPADGLPDGVQVIDSQLIDSAQHKLVGGTAWLFCRPEQAQKWDYMFVDEASQVSLADVVAAGCAARNIVLLGDQMQLPQPTQGVHPGDSGLSVLDYLMQGNATVPHNKGIFLGLTYRMHPEVCEPVSDGIYEGRLKSAAPCATQRLVLNSNADPALKPTGIVYLPVPHANRSQSAQEEASRIRSLRDSLLQQSWINRDGEIKPITDADILIVAPFNAQKRELRRQLGDNARIGTVDKFQGQEAAVAIVSMTTSDGDNMVRGVDFLFSKNRLNVAVSRAKCLAIVVASPGLHLVDCKKIEDMPLLNFYALLTQPNTSPPSAVHTESVPAKSPPTINRRNHMQWNQNHLTHFFGSDEAFVKNYCEPNTLAPTGGTTVRNQCRMLAERLAILMPNAAHSSPGFDIKPRPWLVVSCFTGLGGIMDGNWRVAVFFYNSNFYIGFHLKKDATRDLAGLRLEVFNRHLLGQYHNWTDILPTNDHWCIQVEVPEDGNFSETHPLSEGQPFAQVLQSINREKFSTVNPEWYSKYLTDRGELAHGVIVPSVTRLPRLN